MSCPARASQRRSILIAAHGGGGAPDEASRDEPFGGCKPVLKGEEIRGHVTQRLNRITTGGLFVG